jgi:cholesterol transport system auxiliary component
MLLAVAGCGSAPTPAFDLSAGRLSRANRIQAQLAVAEPTALQPYETERIAARTAAGTVSLLPGGQWADRLPRLVQARMIEALEGASRNRAVGRPGDAIVAENQLLTEIRGFHLDARTGEAVVELSVKLVDAKSGRVLNGRVFVAKTPVKTDNVAEVAPALDRSLNRVFANIIGWLGSGSQGSPVPRDPALRTSSL